MPLRLAAALSAFSLLTFAVAQQPHHTAPAAKSDGLQYVAVNDPLFGIQQGSLPFFAGWRGNPTVDRTDGPNLAYHMVSPDNSEAIITPGKPINTVTPAFAEVAKFRPNTIVTVFPSAAEMLTRYIVPQLHLEGQVSAPEPINTEAIRNYRERAAAQGVLIDVAAVRITSIPNVGEAYISATSSVYSRGARTESSQTFVRIFTAPAGRLDALVAAFRALPAMQMNPDWLQRQQARDQQGQQQSNANGQQNQQTFNALSQSQAAIEQHHAQTAAAIAAMQSQTQQTIQNRNMIDAQHGQQNISDAGALQNSVIRNDNVSYKWCNATTNQVQWIWNSTLPPAGEGWNRCP